MKNQWLNLFLQHEFEPLNHYFARHMLKLAFPEAKKAPEESLKALYLASGLVCHEAARGNVCLNLQDYAGNEFPINHGAAGDNTVQIPDYDQWLNSLEFIDIIGKPGSETPLILEEEGGAARLYLCRYWLYEHNLAQKIRQRLKPQELDGELLQAGLQRLFPDAADAEPDLQKKAAETALRKKFSVISGGPGTGKTTTVLKILALLLEQAGRQDFHVQLAAPTGKAASRLQESIMSGKQKLLDSGLISGETHDRIQEDTSTIHRLLGNVPNSAYFKHDGDHPLSLDCLIVDEASMIDLALMCKLVAAIPDRAKLIFLGDMDQLSSVEAGSVFGDICSAYGLPDSPLGRSIIKLRKSYRFEADKGIGRLSRLINKGKSEDAWEFMHGGTEQQVAWFELPARNRLKQIITRKLLPHYRAYHASGDIRESFRKLRNFAILCALRKGPYGAIQVNRLIEEILVSEELIPVNEKWYSGRPIMITRNDYQLQLFNGDIGISSIDPEDGGKKIFFATTDPEKFRKVSAARLPEHETVYAMTIHKSQGSEWHKTLLLFPDTENEVLTRELVYTGLTRAREHVELWTTEHIFKLAVQNKCKRNSGLAAKLLA